MAAQLDTSVVVRYLTLDPPDQGERARALIDSPADLMVTLVVLAEVAYVLTRLYGVAREAAVDLLVDFLARRNIELFELAKSQVVEALLLCRPSGRVSFADALLWAAVRASPTQTVYTFDRAFPAHGVDRRLL